MTDRAELVKRLLEIAGELHEGDSDILFLKEAATALSAEGGADHRGTAQLRALRGYAILTVFQPGISGETPIAYKCDLCRTEWKPEDTENHAENCPLSYHLPTTQAPGADLVAAKIEAVLETANEVIGDTEGPRTPAQARLTLALYEYDPVRFFLGLKEGCACESKDDCDECLTNDEALARIRALALRSAGGE